MRRAWPAIVLGGAAVASATQVQIHAPGMRSATGHGQHGTPLPVELSGVAIGGYLRRVVQTRGTLTPLDAGGEPHPSAWVLQDEEASVWMIGKEPKGKGWRLDPTYEKAKSIAPAPRPGAADSAPPAP